MYTAVAELMTVSPLSYASFTGRNVRSPAHAHGMTKQPMVASDAGVVPTHSRRVASMRDGYLAAVRAHCGEATVLST